MTAFTPFISSVVTGSHTQHVFTSTAFAKPECPTIAEAAAEFVNIGAVPGDGAVYVTPKGTTNTPRIEYTFELSISGNVRRYGPAIPVYSHPNVIVSSDCINGFVWDQINAAGNRTSWVYKLPGGIQPFDVEPSPDLSALEGASQGLDWSYAIAQNVTLVAGDTVTGSDKALYRLASGGDPSIDPISGSGDWDELVTEQLVLTDVLSLVRPLGAIITTQGYSTINDGGGATYKRVAVVPDIAERGWAATDGSAHYWEIQNSVLNPYQFGALWDSSTDDTAAVLRMSRAAGGKSAIQLPSSSGWCVLDYFEIPPVASVQGGGVWQTVLQMRTGATGEFMRWNGADRVVSSTISGIYLNGNNDAGTIGLSLNGISYSTFRNVYIREFDDGISADGFVVPTNQQVSNNTLINVRSNNNAGRGCRLYDSTGAGNVNTANTFIGCEFGGNAGAGFVEESGERNVHVNTTIQGNGVKSYFNGRYGELSLYSEDAFRENTEFGPAASYVITALRGSYSMLETIVVNDAFFRQRISTAESSRPRVLFDNPLLEATKGAYASVNALVVSKTIHAGSRNYAKSVTRLSFGGGAAFQGIVVDLNKTGEQLQGQWVTMMLTADIGGLANPATFRCYAQSDNGAEFNATTGELMVKTVPTGVAPGIYAIPIHVRFSAVATGLAQLSLYTNYDAHAGASVIDVESIQVLEGVVNEYKAPNVPALTMGTIIMNPTPYFLGDRRDKILIKVASAIGSFTGTDPQNLVNGNSTSDTANSWSPYSSGISVVGQTIEIDFRGYRISARGFKDVSPTAFFGGTWKVEGVLNGQKTVLIASVTSIAGLNWTWTNKEAFDSWLLTGLSGTTNYDNYNTELEILAHV